MTTTGPASDLAEARVIPVVTVHSAFRGRNVTGVRGRAGRRGGPDRYNPQEYWWS